MSAVNPGYERLQADALRTLLTNWRGMCTVPSAYLYPHQWSWDSAFISIGLAGWHQRRAELELASIFAGQWSDGMLPHIVFNNAVPDEAYFPGPAFWRSPAPPRGPILPTSGITQPPVHAGAAVEIYRKARDAEQAKAYLERIFPALRRQLDHLSRTRDLGGADLLSIIHPWESGLDNSPLWDAALAHLDVPHLVEAPHRPDIAHVDPRERPDGVAYSKYIHLVEMYRDAGYSDDYLRSQHPFAVEDPLFNSCYIWALDAMADVAEEIGAGGASDYRERAAGVRRSLAARLWDDQLGAFQALDVRHGERTALRTVGGLIPLQDPHLDPQIARSLRDTLRSPSFELSELSFGVPSNDLLAPTFDRRLYWRGPTWVNTNWLLWRGLKHHGFHPDADNLRSAVLNATMGSGLFEYFDPLDGSGRGSNHFGWTASLVLNLLDPTQLR